MKHQVIAEYSLWKWKIKYRAYWNNSLVAKQETKRKANSLRIDNGTEYINEKVREVLKSRALLELLSPNVNQCNDMAEQENRTLCDTARSLLFNTNLSGIDCHLIVILQTEAIGTAAYLCNRVPNRGIMNTTPYLKWYGQKLNVSHLRVFGAKAFVHILESMRRKIDSKAKKTVFVGLTDKIYRVFDPIKKVIERVSDVLIKNTEEVNNQVLFPLSWEGSRIYRVREGSWRVIHWAIMSR